MKIVVVGSGPAGAFAALGALEAGHHVTMLDVGLELEPEKQRLKQRLQNTPHHQWSKDDLQALQALSDHTKKIHKTVLGSDFAVRPAAENSIRFENFHGIYSSARGGLSNLWGRGIEPPHIGECEHWIFWKELESYYPKVLDHLPLAAEDDNLAKVMPLYTTKHQPHTITSSAQELLDRWNRNQSTLNRSGIHFGKTRLAFHQKKNAQTGCQLCGMCSYGCAYDALYTTNELLDSLLKNYPDRFEYKPGHRVIQFAEKENNRVVIECDMTDGSGKRFVEAERLILAAGAIQTTAIAMRSLNVERATLKNSDLIIIPLFKFFGKAAQREPHHSLSQLTLTIKDPGTTSRTKTVHLFGQNAALHQLATARLPRLLYRLLSPFISYVINRLYIGICCLHSNDSKDILVYQERGNICFNQNKTLRHHARQHYWELCLLLLRQCLKTGLLPVVFVGALQPSGRSFHYGGSMPAAGTEKLSTDASGKLRSCRRTYIADASAMPDIPGHSFTLSIMANAYRVAFKMTEINS